MIPLLPFAAGMVAGGLIVRLLRDEKTQAGVKKAQQNLREATDSGLAMLKTSSATMKRMLWSEGEGGARQPSATAKKKPAPRRKKPAATTTEAGADAQAPAPKTTPRKRAVKAVKPTAGGQDAQS